MSKSAPIITRAARPDLLLTDKALEIGNRIHEAFALPEWALTTEVPDCVGYSKPMPVAAERSMQGIMYQLPAKLRRMSRRRKKIVVARRFNAAMQAMQVNVIGPVIVHLDRAGGATAEAKIQPANPVKRVQMPLDPPHEWPSPIAINHHPEPLALHPLNQTACAPDGHTWEDAGDDIHMQCSQCGERGEYPF